MRRMFKISTVAISLLFCINISLLNAQIINFQDQFFKNALVSNGAVNTNSDNEITIQEAAAYTGALNISFLGISSISGIEYFTQMTELDCSMNGITSLSFSQNINLVKLNCSEQGAGVFALDFSNNVNLTNLNCNYNNITSINLNNNLLLDSLSLIQVKLLNSLNLDNLINLRYLSISFVPNSPTGVLTNNLQNIDLSNNTLLRFFSLAYMGGLDTIDFTNNSQLNEIAFGFTELTSIVGLENLDSLKNFTCNNCGLSGFVDLSNNEALEYIGIYDNSIEGLSVKNGNNQNIYCLTLTQNPNLSCVEVDNVSYSNANWFVNNWIDPNVQFNDYCRSIPESICIVGLDSQTGKNLVVWEPNYPSYIDSIFIYRQASTANFQKIGSVSTNDFSTFLDLTALPNVQPYKYKLTALDSANNETPATDAHKTIHLTISQGVGSSWNLIWNLYEGLAVDNYKLFRGTNSSNFQEIAQISGNFNSYSDFTAPIGSSLYYQIVFESPTGCDPLKSLDYGSSKSNIVSNGIGAINELNSVFSVYLNEDKNLVIQHNNNEHAEVSIVNLLGQRLIEDFTLNSSKIEISTCKFTDGIYIVKINQFSSKFVK